MSSHWISAYAIAFAVVAGTSVSTVVADEPRVHHGAALAVKKGDTAEVEAAPRVLGTLHFTHTSEAVVLSEKEPSCERFGTLVRDRVTGTSAEMAPELLTLLRNIARDLPGSRFEIVSGFRSPKLNETMRKKGHHVASHSEHSLGHAVDFRVIPPTETKGIDPREMEKKIRALGWTGGVGVYPLEADWFVHADVGRNRRWNGK